MPLPLPLPMAGLMALALFIMPLAVRFCRVGLTVADVAGLVRAL